MLRIDNIATATPTAFLYVSRTRIYCFAPKFCPTIDTVAVLNPSKGKKNNGIYLAVMHSGITNAPLAGKLGIDEVITGKRNNLIHDFLGFSKRSCMILAMFSRPRVA